MKIKKIFVGILALLLCMYAIAIMLIGRVEDEKLDISQINITSQEINEKYSNGQQIHSTKEYEIIYCDDEL